MCVYMCESTMTNVTVIQINVLDLPILLGAFVAGAILPTAAVYAFNLIMKHTLKELIAQVQARAQ